MKSFIIYKLTCASCSCSYVGKTYRHSKTKIEVRIKNDYKSHIFKQLQSITTCLKSYTSLSFKIIDKTDSKLDLKIKEGLRIN